MSTIKQNSLEISLIESIGFENITCIPSDVAEIALDAVLTNSIFKDIPIINTLTSIAKIGISIKEFIFAKKLLQFLKEIDQIPIDKRSNFIAELNADEKFKHKVGEALIVILDKLDDMDKPKLIGVIFTAYIKKTIDYDTFLRLSHVINFAFLPDLYELKKYAKHEHVYSSMQENLFRLGLLNLVEVIDDDPVYYFSDLGKIFCSVVFGTTFPT